MREGASHSGSYGSDCFLLCRFLGFKGYKTGRDIEASNCTSYIRQMTYLGTLATSTIHLECTYPHTNKDLMKLQLYKQSEIRRMARVLRVLIPMFVAQTLLPVLMMVQEQVPTQVVRLRVEELLDYLGNIPIYSAATLIKQNTQDCQPLIFASPSNPFNNKVNKK